jgi:hypothetical protein
MTARRGATRTNRLDTIRAGRTLEQLAAELRDDDTSTGPVLARLLQRLLDGDPVDGALLDAAHDYADALRQAEQQRAVADADAARRTRERALRDDRIREVVGSHACPRCRAPAGEPCLSLGPIRRPKPLLEPHSARLTLDETALTTRPKEAP